MFYRRCLIYLCLISLGMLFLLVSFLNNSDMLLFEVPFVYIFSSDVSTEFDDTIFDNDDNISTIDFQARISDYYPHFPIHMDSQNLSLLRNRSKIILLANEWFGDATWGLVQPGKSSAEIMTELSCPFLANYCTITTNISLFSRADAVVYHLRDEINRRSANRKRRRRQRFVAASWESPSYSSNLKSYQNFFNWTMTYRRDSDIVASYYFGDPFIHRSSNYYQQLLLANATQQLNLQFRTAQHRLSNDTLAQKKLGTVAALISNCVTQSGRRPIIRRLQRFIDVTVYGRCGKPCPKGIDCRKYIAENYYFFLSFENSLCTDYATEKFFDVLKHPIVPVVFGRSDYSYFIPSSGFIDINQFSDLKSFAEYLIQIRNDTERYLSFFSWKKDYVWGLGSFFTPFCDLCLRLHLDSKPKVIENIDSWWHDGTCQQPDRKFFQSMKSVIQ